MGRIITVTGEIAPGDLGRTLVHEHMHAGTAGCEADTLHPMPTDEDVIELGTKMCTSLRDRGYDSFIDPLPGNMGRRIDLVAEISARSGINIVCATGLFTEKDGATAYWKNKFDYLSAIGALDDYVRYVADMFVNEIENGVGPEKVRCGIIKVASKTEITEYEHATLRAAALASLETDTPITTHSDDGLLGARQQEALLALGVPAHKIIIGHSCNTTQHSYHRSVVENGSFIGFDRFGMINVHPDSDRIESLMQLLRAGGIDHILVSNDGVASWRDTMLPRQWGDFLRDGVAVHDHSLNFHDNVLPKMREQV